VPTPEEKEAPVKPGEIDVVITPPGPAANPKKHTLPLKRHQFATARVEKDPGVKSEAEAAKDKLMLALSIASSTLNDAQKAVHDDGPKP
jgi:hypothetical protein